MISEYKVGSEVLIDGAVRFNFWRALTDNDTGWKVDQKMGVWKQEGEKYKLLSLLINETDNNALEVKSSYKIEA